MPLRNAKPVTIRPTGLSDAIDGTNSPPGAMALLSNLVPAPSTDKVFICRSAAQQVTGFTGFTGKAGVTALHIVGNRVYGMISETSGTLSGFDVPFCYDLQTDAFVSISGVTAMNLPSTQATSGAWVPPQFASIGANYIILTHAGFSGSGSNFFGVIDISTFASPAWSASNTATHALPSVPISVAEFNGRAYYACGNVAYFSDSLDPKTITNASQSVTLGDNQPITVFAGLPLNNLVVGGTVQSLIAFKGAETIFQITGDPTTSNLAANALNVGTGTLAPNSVVPSPLGLFFIAPDGLRLINLQSQVSSPIGSNGSGVSVPFINAVTPSRICAAFNENTLRIAVQNGTISSQPVQEYWYHLNIQRWTGPHTFASALLHPCYYGSYTFLQVATGVNAKLWKSRVVPLPNASYAENGTDLTWQLQTVLLPDNQQMEMNAIVQSTAALAMPGGLTVNIIAANETGTVIGNCAITAPMLTASLWGGFNWGAATWGQITGYFQQYRLNWTAPLVFKQMSILLSGKSSAGFAAGNIYLRYQILGYMLQSSG